MPYCSPKLFFLHNICFCREALQSWRFSNHLSFWFHAPLLGLSRNQNKQEGAGRTNTLMLLKRGQKTNKTHSNRMWTIINPHTITQTVSNSSKASLNSAFWSSIIEAMMMGLVLIGNYWLSNYWWCPAPNGNYWQLLATTGGAPPPVSARPHTWPELPARVKRLSAELLPFFYRRLRI